MRSPAFSRRLTFPATVKARSSDQSCASPLNLRPDTVQSPPRVQFPEASSIAPPAAGHARDLASVGGEFGRLLLPSPTIGPTATGLLTCARLAPDGISRHAANNNAIFANGPLELAIVEKRFICRSRYHFAACAS